MAVNKTDLTLHTDRTGNMVVGKNNEYVTGIVQMLFTMKPGTNDTDLEMGLDLPGKRYKSEISGTRDTAYEIEISKQFTKYTDLVPVNVIAMHVNKGFMVAMTIRLNNDIMNVEVAPSEPENISVLIN